jgi:hypothetical protein
MSLIGTATGLTATAVTIALAFLGFNYMSIAYAGWVSAIVSVVLMNVVGRAHTCFQIGTTAWRRVAYFGLQMLAVSGINSVSQRLSDARFALLGRDIARV